jgi:hypothetical protein
MNVSPTRIAFSKEEWVARLGDWFVPIPETGCWIWMRSSTLHDGAPNYGEIRVRGRNRAAHRVSYETMVGKIPPGLDIDHKCRVRLCVNPDHLEPVTRSENLKRGAVSRWTGFCSQGHPLFGENVSICRGRVRCRTCHNAREAVRSSQKYWARKAARLNG